MFQLSAVVISLFLWRVVWAVRALLVSLPDFPRTVISSFLTARLLAHPLFRKTLLLNDQSVVKLHHLHCLARFLGMRDAY